MLLTEGEPEEIETIVEEGEVGSGEEEVVEVDAVTNPVECADVTDVESSSIAKGRPDLFLEPPLDSELGALPVIGSSYTSIGHVKKNMSTFTGDMTSQAASAV